MIRARTVRTAAPKAQPAIKSHSIPHDLAAEAADLSYPDSPSCIKLATHRDVT